MCYRRAEREAKIEEQGHSGRLGGVLIDRTSGDPDPEPHVMGRRQHQCPGRVTFLPAKVHPQKRVNPWRYSVDRGPSQVTSSGSQPWPLAVPHRTAPSAPQVQAAGPILMLPYIVKYLPSQKREVSYRAGGCIRAPYRFILLYTVQFRIWRLCATRPSGPSCAGQHVAADKYRPTTGRHFARSGDCYL